MGNEVQPPANYGGWIAEGANILASSLLERIERAIADGWIGGIQSYYGGGGSGDPVAFSSYNELLSHVEASRPGDLFTLWSVAEMRKKGLLLVDSEYHDAMAEYGSLLSPNELELVRRYLIESKFNEVLSISSVGRGRLEAILTDLEGSPWNPFLASARRAAVPGGRLCVIPFSKVDHPEFYLVKGKRPNEKGEVPLGGAY